MKLTVAFSRQRSRWWCCNSKMSSSRSHESSGWWQVVAGLLPPPGATDPGVVVPPPSPPEPGGELASPDEEAAAAAAAAIIMTVKWPDSWAISRDSTARFLLRNAAPDVALASRIRASRAFCNLQNSIFNFIFFFQPNENNNLEKPFEPCACRPADSGGKCGWNWKRWQAQAGQWPAHRSTNRRRPPLCRRSSLAPYRRTWQQQQKDINKMNKSRRRPTTTMMISLFMVPAGDGGRADHP